MTKREQLDLLFKNWEEENPECHSKFVKDGIIDEVQYFSTYPKILFIAKEPNNPKQNADDFRIWWRKELKYSFTYRIAEWSHGLIHDFPVYDDIWKNEDALKKALHQIAFMNVKKVGGRSLAEEQMINDFIKRHFSYIHKEIDIIEPDIIITGLSTKKTRNFLFPEALWINSGYDIEIGKYKNRKIIDFYHPSSRKSPEATYRLLQNVYRSLAFKKL